MILHNRCIILQTHLKHNIVITAIAFIVGPIFIFTRESSYCFQHVLAIAILSVRLSVCPSHWWISQKRCELGSSNLHPLLPG